MLASTSFRFRPALLHHPDFGTVYNGAPNGIPFTYPQGSSWQAGSGAIFNLTSDNLWPAMWTSADAAGLPIFPGWFATTKSWPVRFTTRSGLRPPRRRWRTCGTATVHGSTNTSVAWKVNGITGGNATLGTISSQGVYKAPSKVPPPDVVTVSALAVADGKASASAAVTIVAGEPARSDSRR